MMDTAVAPAARAAVFTVVCTLLALGAHIPLASGGVSVPAVVLGAGAVFGIARVAAVRERGLGAISVLVTGCQFGLHMLFDAWGPGASSQSGVSSLSSGADMASMGSMASMPLMRDPLDALSMAPMAPVASAPRAAPMGLSVGMTLAHVLAALAAAWWLRQGEAAVFASARWGWALMRSAGRALAWLLAGATVVVPPRITRTTQRAARSPSPYPSLLMRFSVTRRGPPALGTA
jgi:hypothetical protein